MLRPEITNTLNLSDITEEQSFRVWVETPQGRVVVSGHKSWTTVMFLAEDITVDAQQHYLGAQSGKE